MRYTVDITIDLPRDQVIALFNNSENMTKWQPDLMSFEHLSGEPGEVGTKSKLKYKMGKRKVEMIETITKNTLPEALDGTYSTSGVYNIISNRFEIFNESQTKWISENEFQFTGFMKIMGFFIKGSFPKQTLKVMQQFKTFAEGNPI